MKVNFLQMIPCNTNPKQNSSGDGPILEDKLQLKWQLQNQ